MPESSDSLVEPLFLQAVPCSVRCGGKGLAFFSLVLAACLILPSPLPHSRGRGRQQPAVQEPAVITASTNFARGRGWQAHPRIPRSNLPLSGDRSNSAILHLWQASAGKHFPLEWDRRVDVSAGGGDGSGGEGGGGSGGGGDGGDGGDSGGNHEERLSFALTKNKENRTRKRSARRSRKKILIIMSDTGGGHKASAQALAAELHGLYPNQLDIEIVDLWTDYGKWPFNDCVRQYQFAAKHPYVWKCMYEWAQFPITKILTQRIAAMQSYRDFISFFKKEAPDMIISVHPCCQHLPLRAAEHLHGGTEKRRKNMPFVTVVTDLGGCHPLWFHDKLDALYVPSDAIEKEATRSGVSQDKLRKIGLPIRPGFQVRNIRGKNKLRAKLGLRRNARTALVVGGGDGVGKIGNITRDLANELGADGGGPGQLVVVCGKNTEVKDMLESEQWPKNVQVSVKGFVRNMDQLMGAADCIITKAGPGTIAEACASGLPIMLSGFLPGQEAGNVPFVIEGGFGDYNKNPKMIAKTVSSWLKDPQILADMSHKSRSAGRPEATKEIAEDIGKLLFH